MLRKIDTRRIALRSLAVVALCRCAREEPLEQQRLPVLAQTRHGSDFGAPHMVATLARSGVEFSSADGAPLSPPQVEVRAAALREPDANATLRIVADASVSAHELLDLMFEALPLRDGFRAEFVVRDGDRTRALPVFVFGALGDRPHERGCAHIRLIVEETRVVATIADTTTRAKPRAPLFRSVEDSELKALAREVGVLSPPERPDEVYPLDGARADPYDLLLADLLDRSLRGSVPCSEATLFLSRDFSWQRLAPLVGGLQAIGVEGICLRLDGQPD